jgi:DNA polymerase I-like protein with 3'-5' exonuclease and polymerase domains
MRTPHLETPLENFIVHPVRTDTDRYAFEEWLQYEPFLGIDTETEGLAYHDELRLVQLANKNEAWVFDPKEHPGIIAEITHGHYDLVAHNATFDALAIAQDPEKIMTVCEDTQIMAHLLDPKTTQDGGVGHGLKPLCDVHLGAGAINGQTALKMRFKELGLSLSNGFRNIDLWDETYVIYAGLDAGMTVRLHDILAPRIKEEGLSDIYEFERHVSRICAGMSARGIKVDMDHTTLTYRQLEDEELQATREVSIYGVENVNSTTQVAEALIARGVELTEKTNSGKWKVDKSVLNSLDDPVAQLVQQAKSAGKAKESWVKPIAQEAFLNNDDRVHPRIKTLGAKTGRMSVERFQQLPTDDYRIRGCLIPDEGYTLLAVDYSQVEVRVMAYLAGEQNLIEAFKGGEDIHSSIAARLYGDDFTPQQRGLAKAAIFAKLYGAGPKKLSETAGVSQNQAKKVMNGLNRSFPRLARWSSTLVDRARFNGGFVNTPTGRRLPVVRGFEYKVTNFITQATAADLFKGALVELSDAGYEENMLMVVHDEIIFQTQENPEEFAAEVIEIMSGHLGDVPIEAEATIAEGSWGSLYMKDSNLV